jgi:hypothetical protein
MGLFDGLNLSNGVGVGGLLGSLMPSAQAQTPQSILGSPAQSPDVGDRLMAGFQGFANSASPMQALGNLVGGLSTGQRMDPQGMALSQMNATYQALKASGMPEPTARAAALNPKILESVASNFGPPKTVDYTNPQTGIKGTAVYDVASRSYKDIISGKPVSEAQPNFAGSTSPYSSSMPPPGVDPAAFRKAEATRIAQDEQKLREQGEGAIQFIPDALRVLGRVQGPQGADAIGPYQGGSVVNGYIRPALGAIPGDPFGSGKALGDYNTLKSDIQRLSSTGLKAQFGARPTNVEVQMNNQTFGGLQSADQNTAANILKERIQNSYANLSRNVQHGFIKPEAVPPAVVQYGVQHGFLDPKAFGMTAPAASTQAQPQAIPAPADRKVGNVYQTPRGPARWMGNGWQLEK